MGKPRSMEPGNIDTPWRKRWPGKACMSIAVRDARGNEIKMESDLSAEHYERVMKVVADAFAAAAIRHKARAATPAPAGDGGAR